jgi:hypothetical protein
MDRPLSAILMPFWGFKMAPITDPTPRPLSRRGRLTKFTPERIEQIKNLLERGKSREEIAELLDVTVGSLQVTCSRLGISLRRRATFKSQPAAHHEDKRGFGGSFPLPPITEQHQQGSQLASRAQTRTQPRAQSEALDAIGAHFSIKIRYKGEERTTELPLTKSMISRLALEAEFRDMRICDLVSELLMAAIRNDVLRPLLDPHKAAA